MFLRSDVCFRIWSIRRPRLLIYMQEQMQTAIDRCRFDSRNPESSRWVFIRIHSCIVSVRLLWREKAADIPARVFLSLWISGVCVFMRSEPRTRYTQSPSFWQQTQLLYWGHHYKLSRRGLGAPWPLLQTPSMVTSIMTIRYPENESQMKAWDTGGFSQGWIWPHVQQKWIYNPKTPQRPEWKPS